MTAHGADAHFAILFADISGSTSLYEKFGDATAQRQIGARLEKIAARVAAHGGRVIKSIGDELMCCFPAPSAAVQVSREIHELMEKEPDIGGLRLTTRIGIHFGPALSKDNDLFGDAVNIAARVTALAKAKQTLTTEQTIAALAPAQRAQTRTLDRRQVKGKNEFLVLHEVLWHQDNLTVLHANRTYGASTATERLTLTYQGEHRVITADSGSYVIGRDAGCQLQIGSAMASRQHGKIEHRMGKFVYVDHSANGTYVRMPDIHSLFLHREEVPLFGSGALACGEKLGDDNPHLIHFVCE
jgi:class 3 adenylate cyclase